MGDHGELEMYVRRAIESGLTTAQLTEALTHLGFYAGWGKATTAIRAVARAISTTGVPARSRETAPLDACLAAFRVFAVAAKLGHVTGLLAMFAAELAVPSVRRHDAGARGMGALRTRRSSVHGSVHIGSSRGEFIGLSWPSDSRPAVR